MARSHKHKAFSCYMIYGIRCTANGATDSSFNLWRAAWHVTNKRGSQVDLDFWDSIWVWVDSMQAWAGSIGVWASQCEFGSRCGSGFEFAGIIWTCHQLYSSLANSTWVRATRIQHNWLWQIQIELGQLNWSPGLDLSCMEFNFSLANSIYVYTNSNWVTSNQIDYPLVPRSVFFASSCTFRMPMNYLRASYGCAMGRG